MVQAAQRVQLEAARRRVGAERAVLCVGQAKDDPRNASVQQRHGLLCVRLVGQEGIVAGAQV